MLRVVHQPPDDCRRAWPSAYRRRRPASSEGKAIWVIAGNDTTIENVETLGRTRSRRQRRRHPARGRRAHAWSTAALTTTRRASSRATTRCRTSSSTPACSPTTGPATASRTTSTSTTSAASPCVTATPPTLTWGIWSSRGRCATTSSTTGSPASAAPTATSSTCPTAGCPTSSGRCSGQGRATQNPNMLAYGEEGSLNPDSHLYVVNDTFVNDLHRGAAILVGPEARAPVTAQNDINAGSPLFITQTGARARHNCTTAHPGFVNADRLRLRAAALITMPARRPPPGPRPGLLAGPALPVRGHRPRGAPQRRRHDRRGLWPDRGLSARREGHGVARHQG